MSLLVHYIVPIIHILSCFFLIVVVLLQTGKGADMGAVFGGGSQTLFGFGGAGNFLTRHQKQVADEQHRGQRDRRLQVHGDDAYVERGGAAGTLRRSDALWHEHKPGGGRQRTNVYAGRNHLECWRGGERRTGQWPASYDF